MQTESSCCFSPWAEILGRAVSSADALRVSRAAGRCVLVTGSGGYIGAEMVRLLASSGARQIVLLDIAEEPLFRIHAEMTALGHGERCLPVVGSVCDRGLLCAVFAEYHPELVLHAAALKHVPLMERNPLAATETNALGSWRLMQVAQAHGARALILVSTDKAVAPRSIMGAAKRIAELVLLAQSSRRPMRRAAVRLANVIGSPGSVGPIFQEQVARGGPVTVTHPEAKRYFLTLAEVVALLAQAMDADVDGILVPDPGDPVRIVDLARRIMESSGRTVPVAFTALRPGDKLDESLQGTDERDAGLATPGLRRLHSPTPEEDLESRLRELEASIAARDLPAVLRIATGLVPDYQPSALVRDSFAEMARP